MLFWFGASGFYKSRRLGSRIYGSGFRVRELGFRALGL